MATKDKLQDKYIFDICNGSDNTQYNNLNLNQKFQNSSSHPFSEHSKSISAGKRELLNYAASKLIDSIKEKDSKQIKKDNKQIYAVSTTMIQNPFEFPRQQENGQSKKPEVTQYKASQRFLNPNRMDPNPVMSGPARTHDEIEDQMRNRKRKAANDYDDDGQLIEKVGFGEAGGYDEHVYGSNKNDGYVQSIGFGSDDEDDTDELAVRSAKQRHIEPTKFLEEAAKDNDDVDPMAPSRPRTIAERQNEYQSRARARPMSPERADPFLDQTPQHGQRSYADVMKEKQYYEEKQQVEKEMVDKYKSGELREEPAAATPASGQKKRLGITTVSAKVAPDAQTPHFDRWEETPMNLQPGDATPTHIGNGAAAFGYIAKAIGPHLDLRAQQQQQPSQPIIPLQPRAELQMNGPNPNLPVNLAKIPVLFTDSTFCNDDSLMYLDEYFGVAHLSECTDFKLLIKYPIRGSVTESNRLVVPLRVQNKSKPNECDLFVFFIVDTGSPNVTFSKKTYDKLTGGGNAPGSIFVQGQRFPFYRSSECFKNLNLLGTEFFLQTNTSLIISPYSFERNGIKSRIFYITSLELMEKVQKLANYENQNPSILTKISLESRTESKRNGEPLKSCSDIRHNSAYFRQDNCIFGKPLAVGMVDCADTDLLCYKNDFKVEHHSDNRNSQRVFTYPIRGIVKPYMKRLIVPLRVQNVCKENECDIVVFFVVDTGASEVSFSSETCKKLIGKGVAPENVKVQGGFFPFIRTETQRSDLKNVNLLGSKFLTKFSLSLVFSPYSFTSNGSAKRVFYISPVSILSGVKKLAAMKEQNANLLEELQVKCSAETSQSEVCFNKDYRKSLQIEFSRPSTAYSYKSAFSPSSEENPDVSAKKSSSNDSSPDAKRSRTE